MPKEDKETSKVLKELEYWKTQFDKDDIASFYTIKDAQETQIAITANKQELQERKEVIDNALSEARKDIETIQREVIESNPNFMPTRQIDDFDNEATYKMEVEFDKLGMQEFQRKIESGEIQLDKPTQKTLENAYSQYNHLLQKRELLEKDLQSFKAFDDNNILKTNSTLIAQTQRVLHQIQDDISFTKEAIKDIESELSTSNKALIPLNTHAETKKEIHAFSNLLVPTQTQTKPSFATNLMKQDTQGLIPYNTPQDTKLLAYNETKLLEYKETLHALQKLDKSFKDFMSMPFSIIVDSKGNALPLTSQAIKNFIFHNLYKEFMSATKALNKPLAQLDFKPLSNEIKALPYKANANLKAHLRDINAKTNDFLDSMQEFKNTTKEIKLLPYNKPSENEVVAVDRFRNVLGDNFTTKPNNDKPITDYQVTMEVEPYVRDLAKLKGNEIYADLQNLVNKHREMFDKPSDVFKLIKEIKKNPEFFYNNNRLDAALIVKRLSDNKIGKMGVKKDDGEVIHATKVREKDLIRLKKVSDKFADSVGIIQTFTQQGSKNDKSLNGLPNNETNPTTKQEISKEIESKSTQEKEKKERMHRGVYSVYYDDIMIDFRKKYDPDDDLWFMKHAKLEYSDNGEEVYAALKHLNEVRDNVSIKYDDYVAATEQVKNSLNRAALDIIDDFKACDEALEAIEKIQTKLLDDYPFNQKRDTTKSQKHKNIESKSTQEIVKQVKQSGKSVRERQELIDKNKTTETFTDKQGNTHSVKDFSNHLHTQAKEQESNFKGFLQGLKTENNAIIDTHITKSIESIESKIRRKNGNTDDMADFLRASILVDTNKDLDTQLLNLVNALEKQGIRPNIELKHRTSGYKGLHLQFEFNGIKSEIQLHTKQGWEIKKKQDEIYQVLREEEVKGTLSFEERQNLMRKSKRLGESHEFSINDFASFEPISTTSSYSEKSVLRLKEVESYSSQESFLNSKPLLSEPDKAYNRLDSTLSQKDNLSGGSGNKSLESMQTPLTNNHIIPQNLPEVYKHMLDEIDKQAKQDYKTSIDNLQNALNDTDFKATLLQGYKQVTDDAIESLGLDNQLTNTLIRETQKLESKPNISLSEAIELRKNINEIMRNYEKSSSDLKKFRANKHLDNIKDNIDNAIKNALDSKVAQNEVHLGRNIESKDVSLSEVKTYLKQNTPNANALDKETAIKLLDEIQGEPIPAHLSTDEFLNGFSHIVNKENFVTHLQKATDSKQRIEALNLVEPTQKRPDFTLDTINKDGQPTKEFIKVFQAEKRNKFYVLITARDNENFLLTGMPTTKLREVRKRINNAEAIEARDSGVVSSAQSPIDNTPTPANNPTQKTLTRQEADELFSNFQQANKNYAQIKESLNDKFAKALTKGMNKKDLDSRLTIEQWKQRVLDTQWGDSIKGLENTIFKNFNPRMQKHTQMLTILRALDRNVKLNDDTFPIDFTKILSDIENLEKLTLHPEIYPILDTFKSYAKSYQFAQEISKAKALENQVGSGALATTLEGRIKVFLTNRLFKKLFAFIPYIGDNAAITKALQSAIKDLKYPSEITLETLKVLNKADLDKGFKPIKDKENKPRFEYKANTPLSDKELQSQIRGNTQILTPKDTSEIEAIASNPLIQNMERQAKYNEELTQKISQFEANKENIQQDILNNLVVATQEIKQNTELLKQLAQQLTHNNPIHTPNKSIIKAEANNETYFITTDKNNITAIEKQELQLAQPKTYDELMQRDKNENATLESYRDQYADIAEIKEAQAQKQLLLEYKPEVAKASETIEKGVDEKIKVLPKINLNTAKRGEIKEYLSQILKPILDKPLRNTQGLQAYLNNASIDKMISDKAITKSVENGFSKQEHLEAVADIERLFSISKEAIAHSHRENNPGVIIHRLNAPFKESNALITTKESLDKNKNRIYSVELELTPRFNTSTRPTDIEANKGGFNSLNGQGGQNLPTIAKTDTDIIPQKLTERIKNDLDSNDYAEMLKSLKQLENKQAEIDTFTNEANLIRNTLEKQETEKYEKIVSPLFDKYPIMKEFYNERDINTHIYFKRFKNEFLERYNTQYDFFTLDEKAFLAKYPNFTQQDYKEATTQNLKALKDKNVSINEYVSFAKEYMDIVNNPVFEKMAKEIDSVDKKYWDTHFEMSEQRDSKVNEIIAILKKDIDSIDIANKADVSIDNFHKLGRYLAFMKQPEFGFANKLTFTKTGFFGKFLEQTDIKQRELLGELLSVEKLLEKEGKANRVLQDRLFTIFRLMRGEELLDREIKDVPLARELIEKQLNIKPIKEFGTNYAEHYHSGETAIQKLINEAQAHKESGAKGEYKGQVAGAFHRKELGDIDLVWGNEKIGLQKIVEKHLNDFADFAGNNPYEKMSNAINEIIQNGKLLTENGVNTLWYKNGDEYYLVGISKGFNKQGDNNWVITSYKKDNITNLQKEKVDKLFSSDA
ncbi:hypothetical protein [Helicobacter bilis]|uniref:putative barnase/colicin E5 family endoribonuclease n=1 Tax=Helicobacter bilis TaxID=37372 RepID=UPI001430C8E2|nr:hypothetical protein [Helicobacter bilis]